VDVTDANGVLTGLTHTIGPQSLTDPSPLITVVGGQTYREADFGYYKPPTIPNSATACVEPVETSATPSGGTPTRTASATTASWAFLA
jgi:hypothetical protein